MKVKESKNLKCDRCPREIGPADGADYVEPESCILGSFSRVDDKIKLFFRNGSQAEIKATNINGGREIDLIEEKMGDCIGHSYNDILDVNI